MGVGLIFSCGSAGYPKRLGSIFQTDTLLLAMLKANNPDKIRDRIEQVILRLSDTALRTCQK